MPLPPQLQIIVDRFVAACQADTRVLAATLHGSYARGAADDYSDLDLGLITTDDAYDAFVAGRAAFVRQLGEPAFLESFGLPHVVFVIFPDGAEVELTLARAGDFGQLHDEPYQVLVDKQHLLAGAAFRPEPPAPGEQLEKLR